MIAYKLFLVMMSCSLFVFLCGIDIIDDSTLNFLIIILLLETMVDWGLSRWYNVCLCVSCIGFLWTEKHSSTVEWQG